MILEYCKKLLPNFTIEELKGVHSLDLSYTRLKFENFDFLCANLKNLKTIKINNAHYITINNLQYLESKYKNITFYY